MSLSDKAAEVAEDYRHALEDLTANSRYEISNLTVVARENTEHALAIADTLAAHIKNVTPQRKLPALYVLDSIVKNVGTPYTLFFGRKLYQIFMGAYATVDPQTRRKMDEMLKTWKEPVPGSIDTRPVFPPDIVQPIENALIKIRTATLEAQQASQRGQALLLNRGRPAPQPHRNTPTPPGFRPGSQQPGMPYGQPPPQYQQGPPTQQSYPMHNGQPQYPSTSTPQPAPSAYGAPPQPYQQHAPGPGPYGAAPQPGLSTDQLRNDIQHIIVATKDQFAQTPHDREIQTRLKALLDLQNVVQTQNLNQDQLVLVKNQVAKLAVDMGPAPPPPLPPQPAYPSLQQATPVPPVVAVAPPSASAPPPQAGGAPLSLDALLGQGALAALLAGVNKSVTGTPTATPPVPAPPVPVLPPAAAAIRSPAPAPVAPTAPAPQDPTALLAMLRQSGLLPPPTPAGAVSSSAPPIGSVAPPPPPPPPPPTRAVPQVPPPSGLPPGLDLASLLASVTKQQQQPVFNDPASDIQLNHHSLKVFHPHLLPLIHEDLGPPCTQCGRRFRTDEEGKRKKTAHMDWHFRVHQRIAEAERRGQHRSWYVDDQDWVHSKEVIDVDYVAPEASNIPDQQGGPDGRREGGQKAKKLQYIPVPEDSRVNSVCPICQEKFEMKWLDEAQEWVWMDALRTGDRAYHASCYGEAMGTSTSGGGDQAARGGTPARGTPEPGVLGKRKAEDQLVGVKKEVKLEY